MVRIYLQITLTELTERGSKSLTGLIDCPEFLLSDKKKQKIISITVIPINGFIIQNE